jgi:DNA modification methylase
MTRDQLDRLKTSIKKYGFLVPIITNKDLVIADGEQRWIIANELAMPKVLIVRVPLEEVDRLLIQQIMNSSAVRGVHDLLLDAMSFENIIDLGKEDDLKYLLDLTDGKLERYLNELHPPKDEEFEVPEIDKVQTDIVKGDIIQLGKHRLMCGDSCKKEELNILLAGAKPNMLHTDPPYGVDYQAKEEYLRSFDKGRYTHGKYANDQTTNYDAFTKDWLSNVELAEYNTAYIWCNGWHLKEILDVAEDLEFQINHPLIWVKNNIVLARTDYLPKHEICLYGWKGKHHFYGKNKANVLLFDKPQRSLSHPTMKPLELCQELLMDGSQPNETVLDCFGGSGSTLLASEQVNRVCYMMEIDPRYCEIICQRFEKYTGQKRVKLN